MERSTQGWDAEQRLTDFQRKIVKKHDSNKEINEKIENLDLSKKKLVYDGELVWRISRTKAIDLHVLLLEDLIIFLAKENNRLVLKGLKYEISEGKDNVTVTQIPMVDIAQVLVRTAATDKRAFFLVATTIHGPKIFDFVAQTAADRNTWVKCIENTRKDFRSGVMSPAAIHARGEKALNAYQNALIDGYVNIYRGRVMVVGQERAGKTSLKNSLLGLPFDPEEQSTDGIAVDPSECEIEVEQVKNWRATNKKPESFDSVNQIAKMVAESLMKTDEKRMRPRKFYAEHKKVDGKMRENNSPLVFQASSNIDHATSSASNNASDVPALRIDATSPPEDFTEKVDEYWNCLRGRLVQSDLKQDESVVSVDVWDFAGQHLYYASHPVFLSTRAVYLLVCNLGKALNARAQPCARQGIHDVLLENPNGETNLENLLSWLVTIHTITARERTAENASEQLPYIRPPVFIVGTHADKPFEDVAVMKSQIEKRISGKEYERQVIRPLFSIDNTRSALDKEQSQASITNKTSLLSRAKKFFGKGPEKKRPKAEEERITNMPRGDEIEALRNRIMEVLRQEPYMGEKIPIRWLNFEKVIKALVAERFYHMELEQLERYAREVCFITDEEEFFTLVNFYHDIGMIIKHRSTIVLQAQWLIDLFKQLITIPPFEKTDPVSSKYWLQVERSGILSMELVDCVFSKYIQQGLVKDDILDMMEQFGLIAKFTAPPADVKYFVPCQLKSSPASLCEVEPSADDPCPLYVRFVVSFVPHGLFSQLISRTILWCSKTGCTQPPNLYLNGAWFVIGKQVICDLIMICRKGFIKIVLKHRSQDGVMSMPELAETATSVRMFVERFLQVLPQDLPYFTGLQYEFCVACPYCLQSEQECVNHSQSSCQHDDCVHLLQIKQGERLICMKSVCEKVLIVPGLEKWLPQKTNQNQCPSTIISTPQSKAAQHKPGRSDTVLRVTLLASEWSSSMGGLSTINRQLATLLAKHKQVEVTLLVPQFACSEEEKRAARSNNVAIREAERRPGYDDLDWLSFPPKDLAIDIVIGHGGKLGKQAQVIRESHCCQWVQVVHTAPEELGMHKDYPKAIAKGEEKNRTEVDLCKLANLVVAVGPKLAEAYSSYLRSCKEHQDVVQLTPGTFSEFSDVKQATNESDKFKVLTFGRGDPEDFSLKGYDIAAKAIVELNDRSYRLVFVGAPDGKQDEVAGNLLKSGISKDQLTVRQFVTSKERLKELFCEADLAIMPSRTEGFGLTALEALSAGLPILVSGNSGFGDALRGLPLGKPLVVDSAEPKDWAEAIRAVRQKDRAERLEEVQRLRTCYEEKYSWEKQCDDLVEKMWSIARREYSAIVWL